jgi:secondary thiamine-phosphate synthase enzyme
MERHFFNFQGSAITLAREKEVSALKIYYDSIYLQTQECLQFIDLTDLIIELVRESGVGYGVVNVQTKHTTTAIVVNENEPLLLEDMKRILERFAPQDGEYQHNDFQIRTVNLLPDEDQNGHSHCKAMLLGTSETLNIVDGTIQLGQWQRIFFIELDKPKRRVVSVMVMGSGA